MTHTIDLKTKIIFGKNSLKELPSLLKMEQVKKLLIVYGGGSVKRNGIYQQVVKLLENNNINYGDFGGIEPNPRHSTMDKAANKIKAEGYDFILGIGGGSVIDSIKVIAATASHEWKTCWNLVKGKSKITNPIMKCGAIITLAGTASENNAGSVVTNEDKKEKYAVMTQAPVFAIENPEFTFTVSKWQTASGAFDCFSHLLEQYYGATDFDYTDNLGFALMKTLIENVPKALKNPKDYLARENILITTSFALNHVIHFKKKEIGGDWVVHALEHSISALWDVTHGAGLALITPTYLRWAINKSPEYKRKTRKLGKALFNIDSAEKTIDAIEDIIKLWSLPTKYSDFKEITNINEEDVTKLIKHTTNKGALNLTDDDMKTIFTSIPK